jgi:hypothetical protein
MANKDALAIRTGALIDSGHVAYKYELRHMQHHRFRDRITVYYDGTLFFERYCYGESAGLTGSCRASGMDEEGVISWQTEGTPLVVVKGLPAQLEHADADLLKFTGTEDVWDRIEKLRKAGGYSVLKRKLANLFGKS